MRSESSQPQPFTNVDHDCTAVGYLTHWATRLLLREADRELRPLNISAAQLAPLLILCEHGPMLQRDIVKLSAVAQPAMVATLAKLEQDALIERRSDERDKRAALVTLTRRGHELVEAARPALLACNARALAVFSPQEQETLVGLLSRLIASLEAKSSSASPSASDSI